MSPPVYFGTLLLFAGSILAVFAMKYFTRSMEARARIASDKDHEARFAGLESELVRLSAAVSRIEKLLNEVE